MYSVAAHLGYQPQHSPQSQGRDGAGAFVVPGYVGRDRYGQRHYRALGWVEYIAGKGNVRNAYVVLDSVPDSI